MPKYRIDYSYIHRGHYRQVSPSNEHRGFQDVEAESEEEAIKEFKRTTAPGCKIEDIVEIGKEDNQRSLHV